MDLLSQVSDTLNISFKRIWNNKATKIILSLALITIVVYWAIDQYNYSSEVFKNPSKWLPWNYKEAIPPLPRSP